jgi:hypothetical protein
MNKSCKFDFRSPYHPVSCAEKVRHKTKETRENCPYSAIVAAETGAEKPCCQVRTRNFCPGFSQGPTEVRFRKSI